MPFQQTIGPYLSPASVWWMRKDNESRYLFDFPDEKKCWIYIPFMVTSWSGSSSNADSYNLYLLRESDANVRLRVLFLADGDYSCLRVRGYVNLTGSGSYHTLTVGKICIARMIMSADYYGPDSANMGMVEFFESFDEPCLPNGDVLVDDVDMRSYDATDYRMYWSPSSPDYKNIFTIKFFDPYYCIFNYESGVTTPAIPGVPSHRDHALGFRANRLVPDIDY